MKLEEIREVLKKDGYFIYREHGNKCLAIKQNNDFTLLEDNIRTYDADRPYDSPLSALKRQVNRCLLGDFRYVDDLTTVIPLIDFDIFKKYDARTVEIKQHKQLLSDIMESKSVFGRKKYRLVYYESFGRHYYLIKDYKVFETSEEMFDKADIDSAYQVDNIDMVSRALIDDMKNQYQEKYEREVQKWNSI